jgi:hypothetical protein
VGQSVICAAVSALAEPIVSVPVSDTCCDLLELFAGVSDGRAGQGCGVSEVCLGCELRRCTGVSGGP